MSPESRLVLVAMSGGVDSSVAAGLLREQGYDVAGVTLLFRPCGDAGRASWCCGSGAAENARAVCQTLGIRHYNLDCAAQFETAVLQGAWNEYRQGRTPSPCIHCNTHIKFAVLYERACALGARYLATGHYARVVHGPVPELRCAAFAPKDQTYFLFGLGRDVLNRTLFPLSALSKQEVRALATQWGLCNAERPESQDACFVNEDGSFAQALCERFGGTETVGPIVDPAGQILGTHRGVHRYTVGQRRGLGVATGQRAYVSQIDASRHAVTLTRNPADLLRRALIADAVTWTGGAVLAFPLRCQARIRYRSAPADAVVTVEGDCLRVVFDVPQKAITPGQAVVLYDGNRVLGGAWIRESLTE